MSDGCSERSAAVRLNQDGGAQRYEDTSMSRRLTDLQVIGREGS